MKFYSYNFILLFKLVISDRDVIMVALVCM